MNGKWVCFQAEYLFVLPLAVYFVGGAFCLGQHGKSTASLNDTFVNEPAGDKEPKGIAHDVVHVVVNGGRVAQDDAVDEFFKGACGVVKNQAVELAQADD